MCTNTNERIAYVKKIYDGHNGEYAELIVHGIEDTYVTFQLDLWEEEIPIEGGMWLVIKEPYLKTTKFNPKKNRLNGGYRVPSARPFYPNDEIEFKSQMDSMKNRVIAMKLEIQQMQKAS